MARPAPSPVAPQSPSPRHPDDDADGEYGTDYGDGNSIYFVEGVGGGGRVGVAFTGLQGAGGAVFDFTPCGQ